MFHIVLHEPEIASNTGNIGRTCVATGSALDLIEPLGFLLNDKMLKRAGMDYWQELDVHRWMNYQEWYEDAYLPAVQAAASAAGSPEAGSGPAAAVTGRRAPRVFYATTKAHQLYTEVHFQDGDYLMFGKESAGIPEEILIDHEEDCIRIPMFGETRSLNLANSVAVVLYEALRQQNFENLKKYGELHRLQWKEKTE